MKVLALFWRNESRVGRDGSRGRATDHSLQMVRILLIIFGIVIAAVGGVVAYRAYFLAPPEAIVISESGVREVPDYFRIVGGLILFVVGAAIAFTAGTRKVNSNKP